MQCLECHQHQHEQEAVAVCQTCGAAVCEEHAVIGTRRIRRGPIFGAPDEAEVRKVQCAACAAARAPVPGTGSS